MIAVVQRVKCASVSVDGVTIAEIGHGMLVLVAIHATDQDSDVAWMGRKLPSLRIFTGAERNFDRDLTEIGGSLLLVSNFTVAAETSKGRRPSLSAAANPEVGREKFDALVAALRNLGVKTETGQFGADMQVSLVNDGPVTFLLDSRQR
jgi:D-tyrosyl-tRNA(Tyr) deacylase